MNHCWWFKREIVKTPSGRHRWIVRVQGETVASGVAANRIQAREASLAEQKRLLPRYGGVRTR